MERQLTIYGYLDYREYLRDYYRKRKDASHGYSYRSFSRDAGFTAPNVLKLVIDGKRKIGDRSVDKFIRALKLSGNQAEYFRILVKLNHAQDDARRKEYIQVLHRLIPATRRRDLGADALEYLSSWLYPTLREMALHPDFRDDPYWISRRLTGRASVQEISRAFQFLLESGFIRRTDSGYVAEDAMVLSSDEVKSLAIRSFHRSCLKQAQQMLQDLEMEEREFGSITVLLSSEHLPELKKRLKAFRQQLHQWALELGEQESEKETAEIVQINLQMYPQTRKVKL